MNEDHTPGVCYACKKKTQVRWKNLYTIGSEGTWLCMPCEMILVNLLRSMAREATITRVKGIKQSKKEVLNTKNWELAEADTDECSGWKGPDECPNNSKFNPNHPACQECEKDALEAMYENIHSDVGDLI